jgi:plastocyanin
VPRRTPSAGTLVRAAACAVAAALAACGEPGGNDEGPPPAPCSSATATATTRVLITTGQFAPYCAKVPVGVRVTFANDDFAEHTVTADAGQPESFDSGILYPGQEFEHAFSAPETVRVHCRINPEISGKVIVE